MRDLIFKYVLQASVKYDEININSIVGKIIAEKPEYKNFINELVKQTKEIVDDVKKLDIEERKKHLERFSFDKKESKKEYVLPNVGNKVVMRFAPNPNGAMSIGHSRQAIWNDFFVKKYNGTFILRFDDTDPKVKIPEKKYYEWYKEDLEYLGVNINKVVRQSSRLKIYYQHAENLIDMEKAYVCLCKDNFKDYKDGCHCRDLSSEEHKKRWKLMFKEYGEGTAVLRIKTDLYHPNPAIRDWIAFRIVNKPKHPYSKERVWPLLNFASAIDDHELEVTHILRGIDLKSSVERQKYIYEYFSWDYPETIYTGKLFFKGLRSTTEIKELIKEKKINGWEDVRLGTIGTLYRRGIKGEAIRNFILNLGINRSEVKVDLNNLYSFNKEIVDKEANRYFVVFNPKKIKVDGFKSAKVKIPLHPDFPERGVRILNCKNIFYVQDDLQKDKLYRFMHLFNFLNNTFVSDKLVKDAKLIHWVPSTGNVNVKVLMDDNTKLFGLGESSLRKVKVDEIVQFERNFFARLDEKKKDKFIFVYSHR
jgi:glutamyl-tRNA synthetase